MNDKRGGATTSKHCKQYDDIKVTNLKGSVIRCWNKNRPSKISHRSFYLRVLFLTIAPKVTKYLGYFYTKNCVEELSKIAQFGHTGGGVKS